MQEMEHHIYQVLHDPYESTPHQLPFASDYSLERLAGRSLGG